MHRTTAGRMLKTSVLVGILSLGALIVSGCRGPAGQPGEPGTDGQNGVNGEDGEDGLDGTQGPPGESAQLAGTLAGTVTNALTGTPLSGVTVTFDPAIDVTTLTTDETGSFSALLPLGYYTLTLHRENFVDVVQVVSIIADRVLPVGLALNPISPVVVDVGADKRLEPGTAVELAGAVEVLDGSTITGYAWNQLEGATAALSSTTLPTSTLTLPDLATYKSELLSQIPLLDRTIVLPINPYVLELAETSTFELTVYTTTGTWRDTLSIVASLPWAVNPGLQNVPIQVPVLLHGKELETYAWTLTPPTGSTATMSDATSRNPYFTPDIVGH